ncbi:MoaD/ThiS family protein [Microbacterium sp. YJN-G]|uniref:MoaD/ThiS family protein n=1 Tax=Microbacterium sp. YJN-G TaxID=2763257 RepID=UPI001877F0F3|nr:MoaD/ThiS family protein [Microbacterium sp. YJN-G]
MTTVRFFAAAQEAVGHDSLTTDAVTLGDLRTALLADHPALTGILQRCAVLVDGTRVDDDFTLAGARTIDVLPPFAGG